MKRPGTGPSTTASTAPGARAASPAPGRGGGTAAGTGATPTGKRPYNRKPVNLLRKDHTQGHQTHDAVHNGLILYNNHQHQPNPSTLSNFCQSMLRISTMHMLQAAGYDAVQANPMTVLMDCLGRYLEFIAESAKEFAEHSGRSQITAFDVASGLSGLGIELSDLEEWLIENNGGVVPGSKASQGDDANTSGTGASSGTGSGPNRPILPSWKGADPGRVLHDVVWNGRERDADSGNVYEWHALPEGYLMPETDEEQDAYAFPDDPPSDLEGSTLSGSLEADSGEASQSASGSKGSSTGKRSRWIPESKPTCIPDYLPPFPGCAIEAEEADDAGMEDQAGYKPEQSSFDSITSAPTHLATSSLETAAGSVMEAAEAPSSQPDMTRLSINTTAAPAPTVDDASNKIDPIPAHDTTNDRKTDKNPYTHVVQFLDSTLPFSTLYSAIPTKFSSETRRQNKQRAQMHRSSKDSQQLFTDTLHSLVDPTPTFPQRLRKQPKLAHAIAKPGDVSDTLFSNPQHSGIIDSLLKQSAPSITMNKFANPGVSVQDAFSPVIPSERVVKISDGSADYYAAHDYSIPGGRSSGISTMGSRKGSFSNSPLSTVSYPPKDVTSGSAGNSAISGSAPRAHKTSTSRKLSSAGTESASISGSILGSHAPTMARAPSQLSQAPTPPVHPSSAATPINPSILSRIGSNFDPVALLGGSVASTASPVTAPTPTSNGVSASQTYPTATPIPPKAKAVIQPPSAPVPSASHIPSPSTSLAPAFVPVKSVPAANIHMVSSPTAAVPPVPTPTPTTTAAIVSKAPSVTKPALAPISLSDLPLSMAPTSSIHSTAKGSTATPLPTSTPTTPAAPKIRFKFSALDSIASGEGGSSLSLSSSSSSHKRDHHHSTSSSSSHHRQRSPSSSSHKKSKKSSRDYEDEGREGEYSREKKKKKKSKSKDRDRDRDSEEGGGSSSKRHHKHHSSSSLSSHHRHESSSSNGHYTTTASSSSSSLVSHSHQVSSSSHPLSHASAGLYAPPQQLQQPEGAQDEEIDCICTNPHWDDGMFMISCDGCDIWFHGRCVGVREGDVVETWYCQRCTAAGQGLHGHKRR